MGLLDRFRTANVAPLTEQNAELERETIPRSASGRAHTAGFLEYEELNNDLRHPEGQKIYDQMYRGDGDVRQVVQLTTNPVVGGTWSVDPYGGQEATEEDQEVAAFVEWALWEQMRPNIIGHLIEFLPVLIRGGFAPGELSWMGVKYKGETKVVPRTIALRLPRTIWQWEQDIHGDLTRIKQYLPTPQNSLTVIEGQVPGVGSGSSEIWLPRKDLVYYRIGAEGDNWEGVSLLRPAYKHWLMKDRIERIDAIAQEREALGIPICYPPLGVNDAQLDEIEDILAGMRTNEEAYIVAPGPKAGAGFSQEGTGWLFEVIGYDRSGSGRDPQPSLAYHTQKIAAAFIAEFMRLGHGASGARATAQVQADPFLMSIEAFATVVEQTLNDDLVVPLVAYNFKNIENPPRLRMSLVDSTSLAQLADFVLKLAEVGALFPDQELEDFLRARADLPPSNPESVKKRKKEDDQLRRDIVTGGGGNGDAYGQNSKPGIKHGNKDAAGTNPGGRGGTSRGTSESQHSAVTLSAYDVASDRYRPRQRRYDEMWVDLDGIEDTMDSMPGRLLAAGRGHVIAGTDMTDDIHQCLSDAYNYGYQTVMDEAMVQDPDARMVLNAGARSSGGMLKERAGAIHARVKAEMEDHQFGAMAMHGSNAKAAIAKERAGCKALERAGYDHGVAAILHGRHDAGAYLLSNDSPFVGIKARYTAILDRSTCAECRDADDGEARDLTDPVRIHRMPPNPDCLSTHSGHNRCRCFETYEVEPTGGMLSDYSDGTNLPEFVREVAMKLIAGGMNDAGRAVAVARQIARHYCATGHITWPGLGHIGTREQACAVVVAA